MVRIFRGQDGALGSEPLVDIEILSAGGIRGRINKGVDRLFDHIVRPGRFGLAMKPSILDSFPPFIPRVHHISAKEAVD